MMKNKIKIKRGHYKRGVHKSKKCTNGPIKFRSGWEQVVCLHLDNNPEVQSYEYEAIRIPYISNKKTKRERIYIPDFLIIYCDKTKKLVEVKRKSQLTNILVVKKIEAAKEWAAKNKILYEIWSEPEIKVLVKEQKIIPQKKK